MEAVKLLHNFLLKACPNMHSARRKCLLYAVESGLNNQRLTLTSLGRNGAGNIKVKNKIKKIDRLLGNKNLHKEIDLIQKKISAKIIGNNINPIILVDWSAIDEKDRFQVLKASIAYQGRAITILDHVELKYRTKAVKNNSLDRFLHRLKNILPNHCKPIIVTDAGFSANWFKRLNKLNWYFVGRVRGVSQMCRLGEKDWKTCDEMHNFATNKPTILGDYELSKKKPMRCRLFIYQKSLIGRIRKTKIGTKMSRNLSHDYGRTEKEPWLLASNLPITQNISQQVVNIYKSRMQIEETFRDLKNSCYGLGLIKTLTGSQKRMEVLMLISNLVLFILGIIGKAGYNLGLNSHFQANTITKRKVLSLWFLGRQIYQHKNYKIPIGALMNSLKSIMSGILCLQI